MHFKHISAKIQPKNMKIVHYLVLSSARQHSIGGRLGALGPLFGYALVLAWLF